jgi:glycosyltransferase involved in cell wall biosynthesis
VVVSTEHSIGETHLERRKMTMGVRALYLGTERLSQVTIAVSDTVRERLVDWGVPQRKVALIPNGVDFDRVAFDGEARHRARAEFGIGDTDRVVGVLGRLDANKRFDLVIRAAAPLLDEHTRLLIVGKGVEYDDLVAVAAECGVADRVIFAGERHDVSAMLSTMDVFVASSAQETFGLSVLEALANGMPALYTTCPALVGVATDRARQVAGTVGDLRAALAAELAVAPRERIAEPAVRERYGIDAVTERIDHLYEQLLAQRTAPRRARHAKAHHATGDPVAGTAGAPR